MSLPSTARLRTRSAFAALATVMIAPLAITASVSSAHADQTYYVPISKSWTVHGHGYGHGHGMSQYGAQGAALKGLGYRDIANFYYPHTSWAQTHGLVRVLISADWTSDLQVRPRRGLTVRDLRDGSKWTLPTRDGLDRWRLTPRRDGRTGVQYHNGSGWHRWQIPDGRASFRSDGQFEARGTLTLLVPSGSDVVGKRYRGILRSVRPYPGATVRDTVNVLPMDSYVQGVVPNEMPPSWAQPALRAQAVAARTYAAWQRSQNPKRYYQICDTTACQVYGGLGAEQASTNNAVQGTAGRILAYEGKPAFTQFSSSSGGWTAAGGKPYLPAKRDPYDGFSGNSVHSWKVTVSASSIEQAHPEIGSLVDLRVTNRDGNGDWNGRVLQIVLDGTQGRAYITGDDFRWQYGLRSTWFNILPTAIITRWRNIGGAGSVVGSPTSGEYKVSTGAAQNFTSGRIYWSAATGARESTGRILFAYRNWGGPPSNLGFPRTSILDAPRRGHRTRFQAGSIYTRPGVGAHVLYGPILGRWLQKGGPLSVLGYPTTNVYAVDGGRKAKFEQGSIRWVRSDGSFIVRVTS